MVDNEWNYSSFTTIRLIGVYRDSSTLDVLKFFKLLLKLLLNFLVRIIFLIFICFHMKFSRVWLPSYETAWHTPRVVSWLRRCGHLGGCSCIFFLFVSKGSSVRLLSMGLTSWVRIHVKERDVFYTITFVPEIHASSYTMGPHGVRGRGRFCRKHCYRCAK